MTLGPRTLAAIAEGPQPETDPQTPRLYAIETPEEFARRVALIAQEEERERWNEIVRTCNTFKDLCDKLTKGPQ